MTTLVAPAPLTLYPENSPELNEYMSVLRNEMAFLGDSEEIPSLLRGEGGSSSLQSGSLKTAGDFLRTVESSERLRRLIAGKSPEFATQYGRTLADVATSSISREVLDTSYKYDTACISAEDRFVSTLGLGAGSPDAQNGEVTPIILTRGGNPVAITKGVGYRLTLGLEDVPEARLFKGVISTSMNSPSQNGRDIVNGGAYTHEIAYKKEVFRTIRAATISVLPEEFVLEILRNHFEAAAHRKSLSWFKQRVSEIMKDGNITKISI